MPDALHEWVTRRAEQHAGASAVILGDERLTYGELERYSNQLARMLKRVGCAKGDRVCLLMPKTPMAIVGIIGIYKAGCVYVPLDPASPAARLTKILKSCDNRWILGAGTGATRVLQELAQQDGLRDRLAIGWMEAQAPEPVRGRVEFTWRDVLNQDDQAFAHDVHGGDAAHILFTSGSTGTPKGVIITHDNVKHFVTWACKYFAIDSNDRLSGHTPLHFDLSVFDIFASFAAGAELHMVPDAVNVNPARLAGWMRESQITQWFSVPAILNYMAKFDVVRAHDFPALKRLLWCGEVLATPSLRYWMRRLPHVTFTNLYGPTETTIASSYYTVPTCPRDDRAAIPIGVGCPGEELLVLDAALQPVAPDDIGDLYIRGVGLSPGYWNDPEKTRAAFVPDPTLVGERIYKTGDLARIDRDGLVTFVGRADSQIKSRGYRIELGEIEAALNGMQQLSECAVVALPSDGFEGSAIGCAYTPAASEVTPAMLRAELERVVPRYMIPTYWMAFNELPKNATGKIDRPRLKQALLDGTHANASKAGTACAM
jgi:amino acid adenylation domain-containing protein